MTRPMAMPMSGEQRDDQHVLPRPLKKVMYRSSLIKVCKNCSPNHQKYSAEELSWNHKPFHILPARGEGRIKTAQQPSGRIHPLGMVYYSSTAACLDGGMSDNVLVNFAFINELLQGVVDHLEQFVIAPLQHKYHRLPVQRPLPLRI